MSASQVLGKFRNRFSSLLAEARLWRIAADSSTHPRVLFFPSGSREGASLLRAYNIAEALGGFGWTAAIVPGHVNLAGRSRIIRRFRPDLLVFQQCRHPLNDGDLAFGIPYVVDTDDADFHLEIPGLAERLASTVKGARGVIAGSRYILDHHNQTNNDIIVVWTSTPISEEPWPVHTARERARPPVVSWAQAQPMDYARELDFVAEIARRLRLLGSRFTLRLYGVNTEWERAQLTSKFGTDCVLELSPTLPYDRFLTSLREVSVGLCPLMTDSPFSRGKSFGKTLAYLTSGVPVVASDAADHNEFFQAGAGVLSNEPDVWVEAVSGLLAKPLDRDRMADNAAKLLRQHLSLEVAAARTDQFLRKILAKSNQRFDD